MSEYTGPERRSEERRLSAEAAALTVVVAAMNVHMDDMTSQMRSLTTQVSAQANRDKQRRIMVRVLGVVAAVEILLSVGFYTALRSANEARQRNTEIIGRLDTSAEAATNACEAANEQARLQHLLWDGLLTAQSPSTPERIAEIQEILDRTFVQRDCS